MQAGSGLLTFQRVAGETVVSRLRATNPLRFLNPRNHGQAAWVYATNFGGGLVSGDQISIDLQVDADAQAVLLTQSTSKVYASDVMTTYRLTANVEREGLLILAPDAVSCFAKSNYTQSQDIHLGDGASLLSVDSFTSGRPESGERWRSHYFRSALRVFRGTRPIFFDSILLDAKLRDPAQQMGRMNVMTTMLFIGPKFHGETERILSEMNTTPLGSRSDLVLSVARLGERAQASGSDASDLVVRMAATSNEELVRAVRSLLKFVPLQLGDDPWARRW